MFGEGSTRMREPRSAPKTSIGSRSEAAAAWIGETPLRTTEAALAARETASGAAETTRRVGETASRAGEAASGAGEAASGAAEPASRTSETARGAAETRRGAAEAARMARRALEGMASPAAAMILARLSRAGGNRAHNEPNREGGPQH
jgi:methyl-accepting chemotaxis protein